jgi:predicted small lipoprotein YifL
VKKLNKLSNILAAGVAAMLVVSLSGCGVKPLPPSDNIETDTSSVAETDTSAGIASPAATALVMKSGDFDPSQPLAYPTISNNAVSTSAKARVFLSGSFSMMGFADWKYDTVYEAAISDLIDTLVKEGKTSRYYRFDDAKLPPELMIIDSAETARNDIKSTSFYVRTDFDMKDDSPDSTIPGYYSDNEDFNALSEIQSVTYPIENALSNLDKNSLNIIVTDLYELRNGVPGSLSVLSDYSVGIVALKSEFSGYLAEKADDELNIVWGSPPTGSYMKAIREKATVAATDKPLKLEDKMSQVRPLYIIAAGLPDDVENFINEFSSVIDTQYKNSTAIKLEMGSLFYPLNHFTSVADRNSEKVDYGGEDDLFFPVESDVTPDTIASFEIRASDELPDVTVSVSYTPDDIYGGKTLTPADFIVTGTLFTFDDESNTWSDSGAFPSKLKISSGGISLAYDLNAVEKGKYCIETHVSLSAPPVKNTNAEFNERWGYAVDAGTLRELLSNIKMYFSSDTINREQYNDALKKLSLTIGLSNLLEYISPSAKNPTTHEIYAVRLYFEVA